MKKELPHLYRGNIKSGCSNNRQVAYGIKDHEPSVRDTIDQLFRQNQMYRENVTIETPSNTLNTKIIGRTKDHIVTINNTVIKIDDIKKITINK